MFVFLKIQSWNPETAGNFVFKKINLASEIDLNWEGYLLPLFILAIMNIHIFHYKMLTCSIMIQP